ncbi:hypothetical protein ACTXT7_003999 [Hymenolepis weldensis]
MGTNCDSSNCLQTSSSRRRDEKTCAVCGDHAVGFNFGAIACESCKAFFRRNALRASFKNFYERMRVAFDVTNAEVDIAIVPCYLSVEDYPTLVSVKSSILEPLMENPHSITSLHASMPVQRQLYDSSQNTPFLLTMSPLQMFRCRNAKILHNGSIWLTAIKGQSEASCIQNDQCGLGVVDKNLLSYPDDSRNDEIFERKYCTTGIQKLKYIWPLYEKTKRERREKIQRNRERKVASSQKEAASARGGSGRGGRGGVLASASPTCYRGSTGSPNPSEYQRTPHPIPSGGSSAFYSMMPTGAAGSNCGTESHAATLEGDVSMGSSSGSWQMSQGMHQNQMLPTEGSMGGYHLHDAPPPMGMTSTPSDIHQQQSTSFSAMESAAYSHDPTHDITPTGDWLQMMASAKPLEDTNITLPYYVKKTGTTAMPSPKYPPLNINGDCKSGVKNVLDGHVWTLEPEDPSNKVRISIFMSF